MKKKNSFLSVVIPVFNESGRIKKLKEVFLFLKKSGFSTELIIVNDGSTDLTLKRLKKLQTVYKFMLISYGINRGKGYALKQGVLASQGKYILFFDIDLSTPLAEFLKFKKYLKKYHIIIGTRKNKSSLLIKRQTFFREYLGKGFTGLSRIILQLDISDFTCGFKCFSAKAAREVFPLLKNNRWGFDSETLFIANRKGFKIKEIPVRWFNDPQTKVKFPKDIIVSLVELLKIRFRRY